MWVSRTRGKARPVSICGSRLSVVFLLGLLPCTLFVVVTCHLHLPTAPLDRSRNFPDEDPSGKLRGNPQPIMAEQLAASPSRLLSSDLHPKYKSLISHYPFQPVRNDAHELVNIILVRSPFRSKEHERLYQQYKDEILFLGISSFEDYPLPPSNPYSVKFPADKYVGLFPGFLHMTRHPAKIFPPHVKLLLMSQSDFSLPSAGRPMEKKYDFSFSGTDQDVAHNCEGWSSYAKNWSFVQESLVVMCGEFNMTGVLVATKDKQDKRACTIPSVCEGKIVQTKFLDQGEFFKYVKQSRFLFVPQIHDASPRVTTQALSLNVPLFMNRNIQGGWKYVTVKTGESFNDLTDFRPALQKLMRRLGEYEPQKWVKENYGDEISGPRLLRFVREFFSDRVKLPPRTRALYPSGA